MSNTMDISEIAPRLRRDIQGAIQSEVFKVCEQTLRKEIMRGVYQSYTPTTYNRTYSFLNAVAIKNVHIGSSEATFDVVIDSSKFDYINPAPGAPRFGAWGSHVGFSHQHFSEGLIDALENGKGSSWFTHPAGHFFENTEKNLEQRIPFLLVSALRARGWDAQIE